MTKHATSGRTAQSVARLGRAIASPIRVRALQALRRSELCLCEISELLGLADSTTSKHMSLLAEVGLVATRRDGRWTYYSLPDEPTEEVAAVLALVDRMAADDAVVREDARRIGGLCCGPARHR